MLSQQSVLNNTGRRQNCANSASIVHVHVIIIIIITVAQFNRLDCGLGVQMHHASFQPVDGYETT